MVNPIPKVTSESLDSIASIAGSLRESGWTPVCEDRKSYKIDLLPYLKASLIEDGYKIVDSAMTTHYGKNFFAGRRKVPTKIVATDNPEHLAERNKMTMYSLVLNHLFQLNHTHVHKIMVDRPEAYGYLPPHIWMYTESFGIPIIS